MHIYQGILSDNRKIVMLPVRAPPLESYVLFLNPQDKMFIFWMIQGRVTGIIKALKDVSYSELMSAENSI